METLIQYSTNYYINHLKGVLRQNRDTRLFDEIFIEGLAEAASGEFEERRRDGMTVFAAQECAMKVLSEGLEK